VEEDIPQSLLAGRLRFSWAEKNGGGLSGGSWMHQRTDQGYYGAYYRKHGCLLHAGSQSEGLGKGSYDEI
jgi:hypothetical protein